jgi:mono/diheme cytochrome c family protein
MVEIYSVGINLVVVWGDNVKRSLIFFVFLIFTLDIVYAQSGEELYSAKCAGCHTIGGGDLAGPDLLGVTDRRDTEWLIRVIVEPDKLAAENDPIQMELISKYGFQMPNLGVTEDEAVKIIEYLKQFSATEPRPEETQTVQEIQETPVEKTPEPVPSSASDPELGKALFVGKKRFVNGGAPCISCHSVNSAGISGGSLATDLSDLYTRLGDKGVYGALKSLQFPVMKDIYAGKRLTDDEIAALIEFFKEAAESKERSTTIYPMSGLGLFLLAMIVAAIYYGRVK